MPETNLSDNSVDALALTPYDATNPDGDEGSIHSNDPTATNNGSVVMLANVDFTGSEFTGGNITPDSQATNVSWVNGGQFGGEPTIVADADFTSGQCISSEIPATPEFGRQVVDFGGNLVGTADAGLTTGTYTASVFLDGATTLPISIAVTTGDTVNSIITAINADLTDCDITLLNGDLVIQSFADSRTTTSAVDTTDTNLFLNMTSYTGIDTQINGNNDGVTVSWMGVFIPLRLERVERDIYIEFEAKMIPASYSGGQIGAVKFLKCFGLQDVNGDEDGDYVNYTMQPQWASNGMLTQVAYGDGTLVENDSNHSVDFNGADLTKAGRSYANPQPATVSQPAVVNAPQASNFTLTPNTVHTFRLRIKMNTSDGVSVETPDGIITVDIDGNNYMTATGLYNKHPTNGAFDNIGFYNHGQANYSAFTLRYSAIKISTGGFI